MRFGGLGPLQYRRWSLGKVPQYYKQLLTLSSSIPIRQRGACTASRLRPVRSEVLSSALPIGRSAFATPLSTTACGFIAISQKIPSVPTVLRVSLHKIQARLSTADSKATTIYKPAKRQTPLSMIRRMRLLEEYGAVFTFEELPQAVLSWAKVVLNIMTLDELVAKYRQQVWYGIESIEGTNISNKEIRKAFWKHESVEWEGFQRQHRRGVKLRCPDQFPRPSKTGVAIMLHSLTKIPPGGVHGPSRARFKQPYEEFIIHAQDTEMAVECHVCGRRSVDTTVRWWKLRPEFYVSYRTYNCPSPGCTGFERWLRPVDKEQPWRKGTIHILRRENVAPRESLIATYFSPSYEHLPHVLPVSCPSCGSAALDDMPRWSGHENPRYLCPVWNCTECGKSRATFEPTDKAVARMSRAQFYSAKKLGKMPLRRGAKLGSRS